MAAATMTNTTSTTTMAMKKTLQKIKKYISHEEICACETVFYSIAIVCVCVDGFEWCNRMESKRMWLRCWGEGGGGRELSLGNEAGECEGESTKEKRLRHSVEKFTFSLHFFSHVFFFWSVGRSLLFGGWLYVFCVAQFLPWMPVYSAFARVCSGASIKDCRMALWTKPKKERTKEKVNK